MEIRKKARGCLMGLILGDALGMFAENKTRKEIADMGITKVDRFYPQEIDPFSHKSSIMSAGDWTDDTQLTLSLMDALIETRGKFDMDVIARKFMECYPQRIGWGKATRESCKRLLSGVSWKDSGDVNGYGNGVMMKIAPLALIQVADSGISPSIEQEFNEFGRMTHLGAPAIVGAFMHASAIFLSVWSKGGIFPAYVEADFHSIAKYLESTLPEYSENISDQAILLYKFIIEINNGKLSKEQFRERIDLHFNKNKPDSFSAYNSFGLTQMIFLNYPNSFEGVSEAILAGGDTDTNASLVGSLLGALNGDSIIPKELFAQVKDSEKILEKIDEFCDVCLK